MVGSFKALRARYDASQWHSYIKWGGGMQAPCYSNEQRVWRSYMKRGGGMQGKTASRAIFLAVFRKKLGENLVA